MVLERWDPFRELRRMDDRMNRLWRIADKDAMESWAVPLDVVQDADDVIVHASVPGLKPEDIRVTTEEGVLTISAETKAEHEDRRGAYLMRERRVGKFHRTLRLPDSVDTEKATSRYEDGVLTTTFPKVEAKKARRIDVLVGK